MSGKGPGSWRGAKKVPMRFGGSIILAAVAVCAVVALAAPSAARAQSSPNSLLLGTITADGQPAPSLRTLITVTANGAECGNTIPQGGTFSAVLSCPAGVAYVNVNGVPVAVITVVPLGVVTVHLSVPAIGAPTPIVGFVPPVAPVGVPATPPRAPATGNTPMPGPSGYPYPSMPLVAFGLAGIAAALFAMGMAGGRRFR